jgi:hypothetical protein
VTKSYESVCREETLESFLPVPRPPVTVRDGQNLNIGFSLTVDNRERKTLKDELAGSVQTDGPAARRRRYEVDGSIHFGDES